MDSRPRVKPPFELSKAWLPWGRGAEADRKGPQSSHTSRSAQEGQGQGSDSTQLRHSAGRVCCSGLEIQETTATEGRVP